jgi:hypothetical protein
VALVLGVLLISGCDDAGDETIETAEAREQIAANVNAMFEAWNAGDGESACSYLSDRGQRVMVVIVRQFHGLKEPARAANCEEAVENSAAATDRGFGERVSAADVYFPGRGHKNAEVASRHRGAVQVQRVGDEWLVVVPAFID